MGKLGRGWSFSSNVEFEAKIVAKSFALSYEEEMTSGPFLIVDTDALRLFRIWVEISRTLVASCQPWQGMFVHNNTLHFLDLCCYDSRQF